VIALDRREMIVFAKQDHLRDAIMEGIACQWTCLVTVIVDAADTVRYLQSINARIHGWPAAPVSIAR
jgi:hypothetical protein